MLRWLTRRLHSSRTHTAIPEFDAKTCDLAEAAGVLRDTGYLILRGALAVGPVTRFHELLASFIASVEHLGKDDAPPPGSLYSTTNRSFPIEAIVDADGRPDTSLVAHFADTAIIPFFRLYFGTKRVFLRSPNYRYQEIGFDTSHLPWHQDGFNVRGDFQIVNCWVPLSSGEIGSVAPGIELLSHRPSDVLPLESAPVSGNYGFLEPDIQQFRKIEKWSRKLAVRLRRGDVLLFDKLTFHRTYSLPEMTERRVSAELRFLGDRPEVVTFLENGVRPYIAYGEGAEFTLHKISPDAD